MLNHQTLGNNNVNENGKQRLNDDGNGEQQPSTQVAEKICNSGDHYKQQFDQQSSDSLSFSSKTTGKRSLFITASESLINQLIKFNQSIKMMGCLSCSESNPQIEQSRKIDKELKEWNRHESKVIKMLLLGAGESGKTTIIKQMKILHIKGFSTEERLEKLQEIKENVFESIKELTSNMEYLVPPIELANPVNQASLDFIKKLDATQIKTYDYPDEFFEHTKRLWSDSGIQACYLRSNEFSLIDSAKYFLDMIDKIRDPNYEPSDQDILHSRKRTSELQKIDFKVKVPKQNGGKMQPFCMYDVGGQRGERKKWIQVFVGIKAILFVVDSSGFDTKVREDGKTNRLEESLDLFKVVWNNSYLEKSGIILFMNKQDILKEKIQRGHRIENYFPEYKDYKPTKNKINEKEYEYLKARQFILDKFLEVTKDGKHRFFSHFTTATDTNNIKKVFNDVHCMFMADNFDYII